MAQDRLNATFAALADPTRRAILARLASGEADVTELARPFDLTQPTISKHLKVLDEAGLISSGRDGQRRPRRIEATALQEADEWMSQYRRLWKDRLARLDNVARDLHAKEKRRAKRRQDRR